jgi:peptidyl-prolyl cis-trans isomerase D
MLNFFRNFTKSRYGMIAVFVFLGLIAIAFAAGDITGLRSNGASAGTDVLAKVGAPRSPIASCATGSTASCATPSARART